MRCYILTSVAFVLLGVGASVVTLERSTYAAKAEPRISAAQLLGRVPIGLLGKPMGSKVVVEGVPAERVLLENPLHVEKVDGHALAEPVNLELKKSEQLKPGVRYRLEGYESGAFAGEPDWVNPHVQQPFQYRPYFVVTRAAEPDR